MMYDVDSWKNLWPQAMNTSQPFVLAMGDPTGACRDLRSLIQCHVTDASYPAQATDGTA